MLNRRPKNPPRHSPRHPEATPLARRRLHFLSGVLLTWLLIILGRLVWLQWVDHDKYRVRARDLHENLVRLKAPRGSIVDRKGEPLVTSHVLTSVSFDPRLFRARQPKDERTLAEKYHEAAWRLAPLLGQSSPELLTILKERNSVTSLRRRIIPEEAAQLQLIVKEHKLTGIVFEEEVVRAYPNQQLAAHLLGYVGWREKPVPGAIAGPNISRQASGPGIRGVAGIESRFDGFLEGKEGEATLLRDAGRKPYQRFDLPPTSGATVWLTIDATLQRKTEQFLEQTVRQHRAKGGSVVIMDPWTGRILALANAPTFDPGRMDRSIQDLSAYVNQAISAPYEPGSIFKIITFAAALEEGVVRRGDRLDCGNGQMTIGRRVIRDTHAYGLLPMEEAFAKSSNVGAIRLAQRMGRETFHTYIEKFGFGKRTEIDLPGEAAGILRQPDRWNPDSIGSIAMGQEIAVTPLQAVAAVAVIANGGRWVRPHLVERVTSFDERETLYRPERIERQILRPETAAQMTRLMEGVITEGTGRQAIQFDAFTVAGKTGTPQKWSEKGGYRAGLYMPSFLGFVPATKPRFAIVVMIDEPSAGAYYGGVVAAPLFAQLAEVALGDHEVQPDDPRYREVIDRLARLGPTRPSTRPVTEGEDQPSQTSALPPIAHSRSSLLASDPRPRSEERSVAAPPLPSVSESRRAYGGGSRLSPPGQNQPVQESKDNKNNHKLTADTGRGLPGSTRPRAGGPRGPVQPMPDLRGSGMRAATEACLNLHLEVRMRGQGARAVSQTPLPGTPVRPGDLCQITFE